MEIPKTSLDPDAVQLVLDTARRRTAQESAHHNENENDNKQTKVSPPQDLEMDALVKSVEKYGEYITKAKVINRAFRKYYREKDGSLSRDELPRLLRDYELKPIAPCTV